MEGGGWEGEHVEAAAALDHRQVRQPHGDDLAFARRVVHHDVVAPRRRIPAAHQAVQPVVRPRLGAYGLSVV